MTLCVYALFYKSYVHVKDDLAEYLSAGADLILSKPLRVHSLELLLDFVLEGDGQPVLSRPDCKLVERNNKLQWAPVHKQY